MPEPIIEPTTSAVASRREIAFTNSVCGCCVVAMRAPRGGGGRRSDNLVAPPGSRYLPAHRRNPLTGEEGPVRLLPRDEEFFDLFVQVAEQNKEAAALLRQLLESPPERRTPLIEAIKRLEHDADQVTHEVVNRLDRTFITPLDREDIHQLASDLDDVMDVMDGTARRAQIFRLGVAPPGA